MSLWVMGDTHLSLGAGVNKKMDRFGTRWTNHTEKIAARWSSVVRDGDTVVLPGDISWASSLESAAEDFRFLDALPGKKLISKGNHDYWWTTASKMKAFFSEIGVESIDFLHNNAHAAEGAVLAGTRGWFLEEKHQSEKFDADYPKLVRRECERLSHSLNEAARLRAEHGILPPPLVFLHFPPVFGDFRLDPLIDVMEEHGVLACYFGHIHGLYDVPPYTEYRGIRFINAAADYLDFTPLLVRVPGRKA